MIKTMAELYHYGVIGQKWGVRNYQNPDGSLTAAGRKRYDTGDKRTSAARDKYLNAVHEFDRRLSEAKAKGKYTEYKNKDTGSTIVRNDSAKLRKAEAKAAKAFNVYTKNMDRTQTDIVKQYKRGKLTLDEAKRIMTDNSGIYYETAQRMFGLDKRPELDTDPIVQNLMAQKRR